MTALTPNAHYEQLIGAFGGKGYFAETRQQVRAAFMSCLADRQTTSLINIVISPVAGKMPQVKYRIVHFGNILLYIVLMQQLDSYSCGNCKL